MRVISFAALGLVVLALLLAGFATAARIGVFRSGSGADVAGLDPQQVATGAPNGQPLPPGVCPPPPEPAGAGGSDLSLEGACPFHQSGAATCHAAADDFYALIRRLLPGDRTLDLYTNVEFYHGPGRYDGAQVLLVIQDGPTLYQWSNFRTTAIVASGERSVSIPAAELTTQPGQAGAGPVRLSGLIGCAGAGP